MAQYLANSARHLRARCSLATEGGARPLRIDGDRAWLAAARAVLDRCGVCWREYDARRSAEEVARERRGLASLRANATDADRALVRRLEAMTGGTSRAAPARPPQPPEPPASQAEVPDRTHAAHSQRPAGRTQVASTPLAAGDARQLLLKIARCAEIPRCVGSSAVHPCGHIVRSQGADLRRFHIPEPWSGRIETAPILFVSSNPSISGAGAEGFDGIEHGHGYPRWRWSDRDTVEFFEMRFGGGRREWIRDGIRNVAADGTTSRPTAFWVGVRERAREILQREPRPGVDYALTEVVHCKSRQERGVKEAVSKCADLYLERVLSASGARVVVVLGATAREAVASRLGVQPSGVQGPIAIGGRERLVTFLPHPNAHMARSFAACLEPAELRRLRDEVDSAVAGRRP